MKKKALSLALALIMCLGLTVPAFAAPAAIATVKGDQIIGKKADSNGAFIVKVGDKYGAYKLDGTQLAAPDYAYAKGYSNGMAAVTKEGSMQVIFDWGFSEEEQAEYEDDGKIWEFEDGKYGYLDETGKLAIPMKYAKAFDFSEDRAFVRETEDGPLLMIDKAGKVIASYNNVNLWYYETVQFSEGLAIIPLVDSEDGFEADYYIAVDKSGKTVYTFRDQYVDFENGYQNGLVAVAETAEWGTGGPCLERGVNGMAGAGYRDKTGNKVISGDYDDLGAFSDGMAMVAKYDDDWNWKCGFINTSGKLVIPIEYNGYWSFEGGIGAVSKDWGETGAGALVDKNGKFLTDFLYTNIWEASDGLVPVRTANGFITVLDSTTGKTVFTTKDGKTGTTVLGGLMTAHNEAGKGTLYDAAGNDVTPMAFSGSYVMDSGYVWLNQNGTFHVFRSADLISSEAGTDQPSTPEQPTTPTNPGVTVEDIPASGTAKASTQTVTVDGKKVEFQMYALVDENGNGTNYIKLRDMAQVLNGTEAQFSVGYDGTISLTTGQVYTSTGTEMTTPFSGDRSYTGGAQTVKINGSNVDMTAITLLDDAGGGYNYFKLRDLGMALGFNVGYSNERGVYIETDKPYAG